MQHHKVGLKCAFIRMSYSSRDSSTIPPKSHHCFAWI